MNQTQTYIPRTTFKDKYIRRKRFQFSRKNILLNLWIYHRFPIKKKYWLFKNKQAKWAESMSQAKCLSPFASYFYKLQTSFYISCQSSCQAVFLKTQRHISQALLSKPRKVLGLSTSNLTCLSPILNNKSSFRFICLQPSPVDSCHVFQPQYCIMVI